MLADPIVGRVFGGAYRVERRVGAGGMGAVYEARHERTQRRYALKVLVSHAMRDADIERRFMREAEAIAALGHANIVSVQDFGRDPAGDPNGTPYLVMDLLEGEDLAHRIRRAGALPWLAAKKIFLEVASALCAAHAVGLVHRDLKPANIFLAQVPGAGERAVLLDFGLVKMLGDPTRTKLTDAGSILGTPLYMSLEQARGEDVDARADVYSLGCIFYEMLVGETPFDAPTPAAFLARLLTEDATPINGRVLTHALPPGVDEAVRLALEKDRNRRYATMQDFADAIEAVDGSGTRPPPPPRADFPQRADPTPPPIALSAASGVLTPTTVPYAPPAFPASGGAAPYPAHGAMYPPTPAPHTAQHGGWPATPRTHAPPPRRSNAPLWIAAILGAPLALLAGGLVAYLILARPFSHPASASPPASPPPTAVLAPPVSAQPIVATPPQANLTPMGAPALAPAAVPVTGPVGTPATTGPTVGVDPMGAANPFGLDPNDPMASAEMGLRMAQMFGGMTPEEVAEARREIAQARAQMPPGTRMPAMPGVTAEQMQQMVDAQHMQMALPLAELMQAGQYDECVRRGTGAAYNPYMRMYAAACAGRAGRTEQAREICTALRAHRPAPPATALGYCDSLR